ncbi:MAG: hypothetical protein ACKVQA_23540 [Burkholderiales bacterium]
MLTTVLLPELADPPVNLPEVLDLAIQEGTLGCIDWREETSGIINSTDRMLERVGKTLDWSFLDHFLDMGHGEILRNNNVLCHVRDQLQQVGLRLAHINMSDDAYRFAVLAPNDFERVDGMAKKKMVAISDDFGPDEFYAPAQVHLKVVGFSQPAGRDDQVQLVSKQRARRIKSLRKILDEECTFHSGEAPDSLVPPYARSTLPVELGEVDTWRVFQDLGLQTSWIQRRASRRLLMGEGAMAQTLRDCWRLRLLERMFLERAYLEAVKAYPTLAASTEHVSSYDASNFLEFTVAAAALSYFGFEDHFRQCAAFYPVFEARLNILGSHQAEKDHLLLALMRFLTKEMPDGVDLNTLAATPPFEVFLGTWEKDDHFAQALAELADWHIAKCHAVLSGGGDDMHVPGYDFFPTWLLAIDRHRERALQKKSRLPSHDLFTLAQPYINAKYDTAEGRIAREARILYERTWSSSSNLVEEWRQYLETSAGGLPAAL